MRALFGEQYDAKSRNALALIEYEGDEDYFLMTFVGATTLPDGRTVVAVNGSPSNEDRIDRSAHPSTGLLNVYILQRSGGQWQVHARHENVADLGSSGRFGSVKWVSLGTGRPGLIVSSGGTWQGYTITNASVFALGDEVTLLGGYSEGSGNAGACVPGMEECWDVGSTIRFVDSPQGGAYRDIVVDYAGKHFTLTEGKGDTQIEHLKSTVRQSMRYHFNGKEYAAVSGSDPVPGI